MYPLETRKKKEGERPECPATSGRRTFLRQLSDEPAENAELVRRYGS